MTSGSTGDTTRHVEETRRFQLRDVNVDAAFFLPFLRPGMTLLDVGCGLGGSARFAATRYRCHITGIDLTPEYVDTGQALCD